MFRYTLLSLASSSHDGLQLLLRLTCFLGFLHLIYAVPTMQAIRDEARLDDGTLSVAAFLCIINSRFRRSSVWTCIECSGYIDTR